MLTKNSSLEIGRYFAFLREKASLTQAQLAEKVTFSPARISRIESGEIPLMDEEMNSLIDAIGTDASEKLRIYLQQNWSEKIGRPRFDHPNLETLWQINVLLGKLTDLKKDLKPQSVFLRYIESYETELHTLADHLQSTDHAIAFVGGIGVGKSTVICTVSNLLINTESAPNKQMVLEVGGGGITICEIHIKSGPGFGIIIEPRSAEEIRYDVADFAEYLIKLNNEPGLSVDDEKGPGVTKEISRAIRSMSNLIETKTKDPNTNRIKLYDPARELAKKFSDPKELTIQILSLMNLPRRDQRDIWYNSNTNVLPLVWLQDTFLQINNCRHPNFTLPKRIEVVIAQPLFSDCLNLNVIDTKGIDGASATRADLDRLFDDPRTLTILCSKFNDAPENSIQQLLQRVKDAGMRDITNKSMVLVLPRPEEAIAVKDNSGLVVEDDHEGYDLKRFDVEMRLSQLGLQDLQVDFFNARSDDAAVIKESLVKRVHGIRAGWVSRVTKLSETIEYLVQNYKEEQTTVIFQEAKKPLNIWLSRNRTLNDIAENIQEELLKVIRQSHWRSIWASVRRRGQWYNLNYYHEIGHGTRTIAVKYFTQKVNEFEIIIDNLLADGTLQPAHSMLERIKHVISEKCDEMYRKTEMVGQAVFENELKVDSEFWNNLAAESGAGYTNNIALASNKWFESDSHLPGQASIKTTIAESWQNVLDEIDKLLDQTDNVQQ